MLMTQMATRPRQTKAPKTLIVAEIDNVMKIPTKVRYADYLAAGI
jgi:hypothetical protein